MTELADRGITLRKPISAKDVVGVNEITDDWSLDEDEEQRKMKNMLKKLTQMLQITARLRSKRMKVYPN